MKNNYSLVISEKIQAKAKEKGPWPAEKDVKERKKGKKLEFQFNT